MAISKIILNGVTQMDVTQDTVAANNLLLNETATGADGAPVVGAYVPASPTLQTVTKSYTPTASSQSETVTFDSDTYNGLRQVNVTVNATPSASILPSPSSVYLSPSVSVNPADGLVTVSDAIVDSIQPVMTAGWVGTSQTFALTAYVANTLQLPTQAAATITPTTSSQTAVAAGKYTTGAVTVAAMPSGSATPAASISGTSATLSTGTNTLTLSKTVSNTPQVSAGYVSSGTAGNSNVSLTANVTTKAAATITPGTTNQTIASGTYLTGAQTISGDANLVAGNIKSGTTIFGVTGTYEGSNPVKTATGTFTGNGTRTIDVACDFEPDLVYVTSNPGTTASSGTVAFIIARDMMAASRYRNNSTTNSHYAVTPCVNLNTSGSSYSWRATYANSKVTLYSFSNNARALLTSGRTYTYKFVKWTT